MGYIGIHKPDLWSAHAEEPHDPPSNRLSTVANVVVVLAAVVVASPVGVTTGTGVMVFGHRVATVTAGGNSLRI